MNVLVSYSRPRGKYGRYVFTVMIYFSEPTETARIEVKRPQTETHTVTTYSCDHCGRWASITTHQTITVNKSLQAREHKKDGLLELYRYDNVEPGDEIYFILSDSELLFFQRTYIDVASKMTYKSGVWSSDYSDIPKIIYNLMEAQGDKPLDAIANVV